MVSAWSGWVHKKYKDKLYQYYPHFSHVFLATLVFALISSRPIFLPVWKFGVDLEKYFLD
jgi:hypothetical protein